MVSAYSYRYFGNKLSQQWIDSIIEVIEAAERYSASRVVERIRSSILTLPSWSLYLHFLRLYKHYGGEVRSTVSSQRDTWSLGI